MSRNTIMHYLDNGLMKKNTELKSSTFYHTLSESMGSIDDDFKPIIKYMGLILIFLIPILLTCLFAFNNYQYKQKIAVKQNVLDLTHNYLNQRDTFSNSLDSQIDSITLNSQTSFLSHIRSSFSAASVPGRPIISNYENESIGSSILRSMGRVSFSNLQTIQLSNLLKELNLQKMKIESITVKNQNKILTGHLNLIHFGKKKTDE